MFNLFRNSGRKKEDNKPLPVAAPAPVPAGPSESERLAEAIAKLETDKYYLHHVYEFVVSEDVMISNIAADAVARHMKLFDARELIRFEEDFRKCTSMGWSVVWKDIDIADLEDRISDKEQFLWVMRLGTFHPDGYYREKCLRRLESDPASYFFMLLRLRDWVYEIRAAANKACSDISGLGFDDLISCLAALEKVRRSERANVFDMRRLDKKISDRIRELAPAFDRKLIRNYDVLTRRALYRILLDNRQLSKDEVRGLLLSEKYSQNQLLIMTMFIEQYELTLDELDEFLEHKSITVQRKALDHKYSLVGGPWPGLEEKLLSPSNHLRDMVRFILEKHTDIDCRAYYIERLDSADRKICILGIGETGKPEDAELIKPFLDDPRAGIVKNALHALSGLGGGKYKDIYWNFLTDSRPTIVLQAYREITNNRIRYGAEEIFELFDRSSSELLKRKLSYMLIREAYWDRAPYLLMLFSYEDEKIRSIVRRGLIWKVSYSYSAVTDDRANWIRTILDSPEYQITDRTRVNILFNLDHAVKK